MSTSPQWQRNGSGTALCSGPPWRRAWWACSASRWWHSRCCASTLPSVRVKRRRCGREQRAASRGGGGETKVPPLLFTEKYNMHYIPLHDGDQSLFLIFSCLKAFVVWWHYRKNYLHILSILYNGNL